MSPILTESIGRIQLSNQNDAKQIGNKHSLHFFVTAKKQGGLRLIDIWVGDLNITPIDKWVFTKQFKATLARERQIIESHEIPPNFIFFNHGPTTDDVEGHINIIGDMAILTFQVVGIRAKTVELPMNELVRIYQQVEGEIELKN